MKAVMQDRYGGIDMLQLRDVARPQLSDTDVLVRVNAAAVNPLDWHVMRGVPVVARGATGGLRRPQPAVLGVDLAGTVEDVGRDVTGLNPGDDVFGTGPGSFAEYCAAPQDTLAPKPSNLSFEQAAAVPIAGVTALQLLRDVGKVRAGHRVLINGAAGGVGTFAVQIATAFGAEVAGVCSTRNVDLVRSLGAQRVFDYTSEDFTKSGERYDVILDNIANHPLSAIRRTLQPRGMLINNSGRGGRVVGPLVRIAAIAVLSRVSKQQLRFRTATVTSEDLLVLKQLIEEGKVRAVIDRSFALNQVPDAIRYLESEHVRGKVVVGIHRAGVFPG